MLERRPRWRRVVRVALYMIVIDVVLLGVAEVAARGLGPPYHAAVVRATKLTQPKAAGTKRVFVYGESTIEGFPYGAGNGTTQWMQVILNEVLPATPVQVVNFGRAARGSFHLDAALADTLCYEPDVVVLCLGHNEFLPRSLAFAHGPKHRWGYFHVHLYRHLFDGICQLRSRHGPATSAARNPDGYPPWSPLYAPTVSAYHNNLGIMVARCQEAGVPVILCAPASNLVWPPQYAVHPPAIDAPTVNCWIKAMTAAKTALRRSEPAGSPLADASALSPQNAELHYWHGRQLVLENDWPAAEEAFLRARDHDGFPFRCQAPMLAGVADLAARRGVPLVDLPARFRRAAVDRPPGMDWFMDACHPRPWGQYLIATGVVEALREQGLLAGRDAWRWERLPSAEACAGRLPVSPAGWREPERKALFALLDSAPEAALDLTTLPPQQADAQDPEWAALRLIALWRCGRHNDLAGCLAGNTVALATLYPIVATWPEPVQEWWKQARAAADDGAVQRAGVVRRK